MPGVFFAGRLASATIGCVALLGACAPAPLPLGDTLTGRVHKVQDGDSFTLRLADGTMARIRLHAIDAPEHRQPYADTSRSALVAALKGTKLQLAVRDTDRYGRIVAAVSADGSDVGLHLVSQGLAWHYEQYAPQQPRALRRAYADAQRQARDAAVGLWSQSQPVPPWEWRRR